MKNEAALPRFLCLLEMIVRMQFINFLSFFPFFSSKMYMLTPPPLSYTLRTPRSCHDSKSAQPLQEVDNCDRHLEFLL